jgi:hypothetical protein
MSKSNADKPAYQTKITDLETILLESDHRLLPTLSKPRIRPPIIPDTLSDNFHFTTVDGDSGSCHAILVYVKTNDSAKKTVYYYDPAGKESTPHKFQIGGIKVPKAQINKDMCPVKGINPEGYCALWSIVVVILWDSFPPHATFEERLHNLQLFNSKIVGRDKVPGLRKWFIATIYHLLMKNSDYTSSVAKAFINAVREHIQLVLQYNDCSIVKTHVDEIARLIEQFEETKQTIKSKRELREEEKDRDIEDKTIELDRAVDAYIRRVIGDSGDGGGGAAAGAGHSFGGGLRRKNKMYRSKKVRKSRRTASRRSKRNYRK